MSREIGPDDPVTLREACDLVFRGQITPWTLRAEAQRGRLAIMRVGKQDFTTIAEVREMMERCRAERKAPGSTSTAGAANGSSETDSASSAQAALSDLEMTLRGRSPATLAGNIGRRRAKIR